MLEYLIVHNSERNFLQPEIIGICVNTRPIFHLCITDLDAMYSLQSTVYSLTWKFVFFLTKLNKLV